MVGESSPQIFPPSTADSAIKDREIFPSANAGKNSWGVSEVVALSGGNFLFGTHAHVQCSPVDFEIKSINTW